MVEPVFLTVEGLAERLGIRPSTVYEWTSRRGPESIPRVRLGKRLGFDLGDVVRWLKEQGADGSRPGARIRRMPARRRGRASFGAVKP